MSHDITPDFEAQIQARFQEKDYRAAYALAEQARAQVPERQMLFDYWRLVTLARLGESAQVYALLQAVLDTGAWYGESILRNSPSFAPLQGDAAFERLVAACVAREAEALGAPVVAVRTPAVGAGPWPLLLALHGNTSSAAATLPFWEAATGRGWAVAAPQSPEAFWSGAHMWSSHEAGQAAVLAHWERLPAALAFDAGRVVLGGHSMGGEIALWLALTGAIPALGAVLVGPGGMWVDEPEQWQATIDAAVAARRTVRFAFVIGTADTAILPVQIEALCGRLQAAGLACTLTRVEGVTHDFSPPYAAAILEGLAFVSTR